MMIEKASAGWSGGSRVAIIGFALLVSCSSPVPGTYGSNDQSYMRLEGDGRAVVFFGPFALGEHSVPGRWRVSGDTLVITLATKWEIGSGPRFLDKRIG